MRRGTLAIWTRSMALAAVAGLVAAPAAWARQGEPPLSFSGQVAPLGGGPTAVVEEIDPVELRLVEESAGDQKPGGVTFAVPQAVSLSPANAGQWDQLADGGSLWRLRILSPGATDLNFGFGRFHLPQGATLHIYSEDDGYYQGPYTHRDNKPHRELWTPVVPGEQAVVELYVPAGASAELELTQVGSGYRDLFGRFQDPQAESGSCNVDVICPEGDPWRDQIRAVGVYSTGGSTFCTGTMIMDAARDFRNFFLTANHCGLGTSNDQSVVVYWNFESPSCGQHNGGSLNDNQNGSTFRASKTDVDVCLIELDDDPDPDHNVYYSGWDRSGDVPAGSVGIHHPNTDEKSISFNYDALTTRNSCIGSGGSNTHWEVDDWEVGTTEPGSSGSGLWDPDTKLLVGFLSGGRASCSVIDYDCFGKFSVAWDLGGSASSRLKDWLDPGGLGDVKVPGADPASATVAIR